MAIGVSTDYWLEPPINLKCRPDEVHVWQVNLNHSPLAQLWSLLSGKEKERAKAFIFQEDRNRYVVAHAALRTILSRYISCLPDELNFSCNLYGKPFIPNTDIRFNLSHSGELVLIAVSQNREVGIDVEMIQSKFRFEDLADKFFSLREISEIKALTAKDQLKAFFQCWTCKEAYLKALGNGLSLPIHQFEVPILTNVDPLKITTLGGTWTLSEVSAGNGYAAALAVEGDDFVVHGWRSAILR